MNTPTTSAWRLIDSVEISAGDMQVLPKVLDAASRFEQRPSDSEMAHAAEAFGIQPIFS